MSTNKNYYEFIFKNGRGKNIILKINRAKYIDITENMASAATDMQSIIDLDIIKTSVGQPRTKLRIKYVRPTTTEIPVTAYI